MDSASAQNQFNEGMAAYRAENYPIAFERFKVAADQGHQDAQRYVGDMYKLGRGVQKDDAQALNWYRKAAVQGHAGSQSNLGVLYLAGEGVPKDRVVAYALFNLPEHPDTSARIGMEELAKVMTPQSLAQARQLTLEMKAAENILTTIDTHLKSKTVKLSSLFGHRSVFMFSDGRKISPNEFGKVCMEWSLKYAEQLLESLFTIGKPGWRLFGGSLIGANPVPAHLYVTMLYLSTFVTYMEAMLHADESVTNEVMKGMHETMKRMEIPDGIIRMPAAELLKHLMDVSERFFRLIVQDIKDQESAGSGTNQTKPRSATEHLYKLLRIAYGSENEEFPFLGHSPDQIEYALEVQRALDNAPMALLATLNSSTPFQLVEDA